MHAGLEREYFFKNSPNGRIEEMQQEKHLNFTIYEWISCKLSCICSENWGIARKVAEVHLTCSKVNILGDSFDDRRVCQGDIPPLEITFHNTGTPKDDH
jgi:hypothetical protein